MPGNNSGPLVSVLMTAYNRQKYLAEAIESVLASTYENFELLISDDASIDNTVKIAREYEAKDSRVKVYENEKNLGQFPNRNKAAGLARGWLLISADSDDTIYPDAISYIVEQFMRNPEAKFSTIYHYNDIEFPTVLTPEQSIRTHFFKQSFLRIGPSGTVIERAYLNSIGGFPEKYGPVGDMFYNLKAAANTNVILLPYIYFNYRRHDDQEINNKYSYLCNGHRYLVDIMQFPELPLSGTERKKILQKSARNNIRSFISHIRNTGEISRTIKALRLSGITLLDLI